MPRPKTDYRLMQLRLPPDLHAELMAFAAETGIPATSFVKSVLVDALPAIRKLTKAARAAKASSSSSANESLDILQHMLLEKTAGCAQLALDLEAARKGKPQ